MLLLFLIALIFSSALKIPLHLTQSPTSLSYTKQSSTLISQPILEKLNWFLVIPISIGTPGQEISLLIDTLYPYSWVAGTNSYNSKIPYFNSSVSSSYYNLSIPFSIIFSDPGVLEQYIGSLSTETFMISNISAYNQVFLLAEMFINATAIYNNGFIGFGYKSFAQNYSTLVENLKSQKQISRAIFSFYINNLASWEEKLMLIGEVAEKYVKVSGTDVQIVKNSSTWTVIIDSVTIGDIVIDQNVIAEMIISKYYIFAPIESVNVLVDYIKSKVKSCTVYTNQSPVCVCNENDLEEFPDIVFTFNGTEFLLDAGSYISKESTKCSLLIFPNEGSSWILGNVFFNQYYVVHDYDNDKIIIFHEPSEKSYIYEFIGACAVVFVVLVAIFIMKKKDSHNSHRYMSME
ncbi:hypothetical protein SteCoe_19573 [Stentor coeruleus]|uniref:Peptidase A1 domain-containing protein n=1 Tax=Stentor coeruleus TaxID=5963 RepID=A0A1R2BTS5_9CILI|nr:hypothetical protein SteCoe_19573 [Stentor coeruleus]